ncbi:MAG: hypothetical protein ILP19_00665, partial [Oscillospiraceae bacterium]|nr:hypothetical protein [Oscillospiraceae bacterium]
MKKKISFSKKIICFVGITALLIVCCAVYEVVSHEYIYIKDASGTELLKADRIKTLLLSSPSRITLDSLKYCDNLDTLSIDAYMSGTNNNLEFLKGTHLRELQLMGQWDDYSNLQYQENLENLTLHTYNFSNED